MFYVTLASSSPQFLGLLILLPTTDLLYPRLSPLPLGYTGPRHSLESEQCEVAADEGRHACQESSLCLYYRGNAILKKTFAFLSTVYNKVDETLARKNTNKESRWVSTVCSACVLTDCPYLPLQYSRTQWTRTTRPRPCFSIFNTGSCQGNSFPYIILFCWSACMG